jgi:DNA-binding beta-propeller fold protein YncE
VRLTFVVLLAAVAALALAACAEQPGFEGQGGILDSPVGLAIHWPYAYVTNANFDLSGDKKGFLAVVDLEKALVRRDQAIITRVKTVPFLSKIVLTADGSTAYVGDRKSDEIRVFDLSDPTLPEEIDFNPDREGVQGIGVARQPYGLALSADEKLLFAACIGSGHVSVVDLTTDKLAKNIRLTHGVNEIKFDPAGRYLYVTNLKFNLITLLDGQTGNYVVEFGLPTATSLTGYDYRGLDFSPDGGLLYVASRTPSSVLMIDANQLPLYPDQAVLRVLPMDHGPMAIAVRPDGREVWTASYDSSTLLAVDAATGAPLRSLPSGKGASEIQIFARPERPDYYYALAVNFLSHSLTLVDAMTKEVIWAIP